MTNQRKPSQAEIDHARRLLQKNAKPYLEGLMKKIEAAAGEAEVVDARWVGFLDWLEGDVGPQMLKTMREREPKRSEFPSEQKFKDAHASWERIYRETFGYFESFSQGRAAMNLNDARFAQMMVGFVGAYGEVAEKVLIFFTAPPQVEIDATKPATTGA